MTTWEYEIALRKSNSYIVKIAAYFEQIIKIVIFGIFIFNWQSFDKTYVILQKTQ